MSKRLKNKKIIVPAVSWVTTVAPAIQLGFEPIMCNTDSDTLGVDINHLRALISNHKPSILLIVHILGFPNKMKEIQELCKENDVILLEDSCESMGSTYDGIKTGNFGLMASFSTYYGHHFSTIEGGLIVTDDEDLYHILLSLRSHGWDRDLPKNKREGLRLKEDITEFRAFYTFYYPGFNLRSTDLQAFIGINQLKNLDSIVKKRNHNYKLYQKLIKQSFWKIRDFDNVFVSNFAYPIITPNLDKVVKELQKGDVEIRPLVCGSIGQQPFWKNIYGEESMPFADAIHKYGLYLPNNPELTEQEIEYIANIVNKNT
jgi:CDP-6-deoxy-D-xylo-4-hexulose-3-dehydrase